MKFVLQARRFLELMCMPTISITWEPDMRVPVKFEGEVVGKAEVNETGELITVTLDPDKPAAGDIRDVLLVGLADSLSVGVVYREVFPAPIVSPEHTACGLEYPHDRHLYKTENDPVKACDGVLKKETT